MIFLESNVINIVVTNCRRIALHLEDRTWSLLFSRLKSRLVYGCLVPWSICDLQLVDMLFTIKSGNVSFLPTLVVSFLVDHGLENFEAFWDWILLWTQISKIRQFSTLPWWRTFGAAASVYSLIDGCLRRQVTQPLPILLLVNRQKRKHEMLLQGYKLYQVKLAIHIVYHLFVSFSELVAVWVAALAWKFTLLRIMRFHRFFVLICAFYRLEWKDSLHQVAA